MIRTRERSEEGGRAGLSQLDRLSLLLSCFSTVAVSDTVFVTLFHTAADRASCGVHKLLGTGGIATSLMLLLWRWLTVSSSFFFFFLTCQTQSR